MDDRKYFGNWEIESHIGSGSFGDVYKIKKEEFGITYYSAMKVIHIPQDKDEQRRLYSQGLDSQSVSDYYSQFARDFIKEIELMARLQGNTNIVGYNDHIIEDNEDGVGYTIYIRMEFLTPLDAFLSKDNKARFMTEKEVVKLGIDMCNALEVCSRLHIIHRDIKPGNIFVSDNGDFKLGDFGIARQLEKTQSGLSRKGTVNYMAPEVYNGTAYGESVDVYSLGIVLYRLLNCNRIPFFPPYPEPIKYTDSELAFAKRIKGERIPYINSISKELNCILVKACECDPKLRYKNAHELKQDLLKIQGLVDNDKTSVLEDNTIIQNPNSSDMFDDSIGQKTELLPEVEPIDELNEPVVDKNKKSSKKGIIAVLIAVILIISIGVGVALSTLKKKNADISTTVTTSTVTTTQMFTTEKISEKLTTEKKPTTTTKKVTTTGKPTTTKRVTTTRKPTTTSKKATTTRKPTTTKRVTTTRKPTTQAFDEEW